MRRKITRLSANDKAALAAKATTMAREMFPRVRDAVRGLEGGKAFRAMCEDVARFFGEGTVAGMTRPLYVAVYETRREAVAAVFGVKTDAEVKAAEQRMLRYLAKGYTFLKVAPPRKRSKRGRKAENIVKRALSSARKFLADMTRAERLAFLAAVTKAVRTGNVEEKRAA